MGIFSLMEQRGFRHPKLIVWQRRAFALRNFMRCVGATQEIDWSVGQTLQAVRERGLEEKTLVIFSSDNGPWLQRGDDGGSAGPLRAGKRSSYEGGHRVPAVFWWPGHIPAGQVSDAMITSMDRHPPPPSTIRWTEGRRRAH